MALGIPILKRFKVKLANIWTCLYMSSNLGITVYATDLCTFIIWIADKHISFRLKRGSNSGVSDQNRLRPDCVDVTIAVSLS